MYQKVTNGDNKLHIVQIGSFWKVLKNKELHALFTKNIEKSNVAMLESAENVGAVGAAICSLEGIWDLKLFKEI